VQLVEVDLVLVLDEQLLVVGMVLVGQEEVFAL